MESLIVSVVIDIGGLVLIWFALRARVAKALEIDGLLAEARKEARLLTIEINETTDRNITLVEDRLTALRELLAETDRRIGVQKREDGRRQAEGEVYSRLGRRQPVRPSIPSAVETENPEAWRETAAAAEEHGATPRSAEPVVQLALGERRPTAPDPRSSAAPDDDGMPEDEGQGRPRGAAPLPLSLGPRLPEIVTTSNSVIPPRSLRERAIDLHRSGFSADIIAARLGATVSEIELLVSLEEGRTGREDVGGT